jgi:glutaconate CoA-transferase subunit A
MLLKPDIPLARLAAAVPDGALLAVPKDSSGVAMAATRELVRRGVRGLHLLCVPTSGMQADILIGAGAVRTLETSAVTMGEYGTAPCFTAAMRESAIVIRDSTCPAVYAALQAGEKGLPFLPLRGLIGTDVLKHREDWKVIDNPFAGGDPIVVLPALRPEFALFHAPLPIATATCSSAASAISSRWRTPRNAHWSPSSASARKTCSTIRCAPARCCPRST